MTSHPIFGKLGPVDCHGAIIDQCLDCGEDVDGLDLIAGSNYCCQDCGQSHIIWVCSSCYKAWDARQKRIAQPAIVYTISQVQKA